MFAIAGRIAAFVADAKHGTEDHGARHWAREFAGGSSDMLESRAERGDADAVPWAQCVPRIDGLGECDLGSNHAAHPMIMLMGHTHA